jgi:hypothetical protein
MTRRTTGRTTASPVGYGDCDPEGQESCTVPLEVNTTTEAAPPFKNYAGDGGPPRRTSVRGVPAIVFNDGKSVELFTGRVRVDIYTDSPGRLARATRLLRSLNGRPGSGAELPPPTIQLPR